MRQKNKKQIKKLVNALIVIAVALTLRLIQNYTGFDFSGKTSKGVEFAKCVDGDTARFYIDGVEERVRFIAVDTPELNKKEYYAEEARDFTCDTLAMAQEIELVYDPKANERDKYGRMIAWVYADGVLLQEELVAQGYAKVRYIYADYLYVDLLYEKEAVAKQQKLGVWK